MHQRTDKQIAQWLEQEYAQPFQGWDFAYLKNRRIPMGVLPWDYAGIAASHLTSAGSVLDMDTGGGELFSQLLTRTNYSGLAYAVEPYAPNGPLARRTLQQNKVDVYDTSTHPAIFDDSSMDLILSRHGGSMAPSEIARILAPSGSFVTQQVGDQTNHELRTLFGIEREQDTSWPHNAEDAGQMFTNLGLRLVQLESHTYPVRFMDVGALVYYLKAVPWEVPNFSVDKHLETLLDLHRQIDSTGYAIDTSHHAYLVVAKQLELER